jgi:hypothetical protein
VKIQFTKIRGNLYIFDEQFGLNHRELEVKDTMGITGDVFAMVFIQKLFISFRKFHIDLFIQ